MNPLSDSLNSEIRLRVLSYNFDKNSQEYRKVTKKLTHYDNIDQLYEIYYENKVMKVTGNHPIYINTNNNFDVNIVLAKNIGIGDYLLGSDGKYHKVTMIKHYGINEFVYNIEVENNNNYYVGSGILVSSVQVGENMKFKNGLLIAIIALIVIGVVGLTLYKGKILNKITTNDKLIFTAYQPTNKKANLKWPDEKDEVLYKDSIITTDVKEVEYTFYDKIKSIIGKIYIDNNNLLHSANNMMNNNNMMYNNMMNNNNMMCII